MSSAPSTSINTHKMLCDPNKLIHWSEILSLSISGICLIIIIIITIISMRNIVKSNPIKYWYYIILISCLLTVIANILETILCNFVHFAVTSILRSLFTVALYVMYLAILGNLILRLRYSFNDTIYKLKQKQILFFISSYIIVTISTFTAIIFYILTEFGVGGIHSFCCLFLHIHYHFFSLYSEHDVYVAIVVFAVAVVDIVLYVFTACYAIILFAGNLFKLMSITGITQISMDSSDDDDDNDDDDNNNDNNHQQKTLIISQILRHLTVFSVAIATNFLSLMVFGINRAFWNDPNSEIYDQIAMTFGSIDVTINVLCVFLQFKFATIYYNKYCKYFELVWRLILIQRLSNNDDNNINSVPTKLQMSDTDIEQDGITFL